MASQQASSTARQVVGTVRAMMILALAGVTGLSVSGQTQREWRDYAGGPDSSRFVAATQINKTNVHQLQVAWTYPSGQTDFNPLVVRGVIYGLGANGSFVALDAATGKEIWIHKGVQGFNGRGVNYWESKDGADRRLIFSTNNILQEIDARTGQSIPSFGTDGRVDLRVGLDRDPATINQQSRIPGRVFENLIILGSATNQEYDLGARRHPRVRRAHRRQGLDVSHRASARRVRLRDLARRTRGRPSAARTTGPSNRSTRSAASSTSRPAAPNTTSTAGTGRAPISSETASSRSTRRTGKRLWHFQTVHHDIWDLDNNSAPQLTTIRQNGRTIDVVAMASKTGYLYVFDRVTGKPIWPIEERPVPPEDDGPRRGAVADAAVSDQPAAVLAPEVHGGRSESVHPDAARNASSSGSAS